MAPAQSFLLAEPWALNLAGPEDRIAISGMGETLTARGGADPRLVCPVATSEPRCGPRRWRLPPASFPFRWFGGDMQAYSLPLGTRRGGGLHDSELPLALGEARCVLRQTGVVGRPDGGPLHALSDRVHGWVSWQVHCFQELARREETGIRHGRRAGAFRRSWEAARRIWVQPQQEEARRALIVDLAERHELRETLAALSRAPRRILERFRAGTRLDRIQELDAACLRDYARRPGETVVEKAGSRQELLAVRRRESFETLENRVTAWVLDAAADLARDYVQANRRVASERVRAVRLFGRSCHEWRASERLTDVGVDQLSHPVAPNYPLQMDRRYRLVHETYTRIREERKVLDDAWEWQRVLWAETGRQLLSCALLGSYEEPLRSTPYYAAEAFSGRWLCPPVAPGPLTTPRGECQVFDARDLADRGARARWCASPPVPGGSLVGAVGCDQLLYWPASRALVLVWHHYTLAPWTEASALVERTALSLRLLAEDLRRVGERVSVRGVVLLGDVNRSDDEEGLRVARSSREGPPVRALGVPVDAHRFAAALAATLREIFDEADGAS